MKIEPFNWMEPVVTALGARFIWAIIAILAVSLFTAYIDRRKFSGKWNLTIRWTPEHAKSLLGSELPEPHSVGDVAITYGHGPNNEDYWGIGYFELFSGTTLYARLCIELANMEVKRKFLSSTFPYFFCLTLSSLTLRSKIREKAKKFTYGNWANYRMDFNSSTGKVLIGSIVLVETNKQVGSIEAKRSG